MLIDGTPANCCQFHVRAVHVACATDDASTNMDDGFFRRQGNRHPRLEMSNALFDESVRFKASYVQHL